MTKLLLVIQAPSQRDIGWRRALMRNAHEKGWKYGEYWGGEVEGDFDPSSDGVLVTTQFDDLERFGASSLVILTDRAEMIGEAYRQRLDMGRHSLWPTAGWLARAAVAQAAGVPVLQAEAERLEFPYFGVLEPLHPDGFELVQPEPDAVFREALAFYPEAPETTYSGAVWPIELLRFDQQTFAGRESVDILGRRRVLLFGPYLDLPPGRWMATMELEVETEGFSPSLRFEWGTPDDYTFHECDFDISGRYRVELSHRWLTVGPSDFRVLIDQPVFGGSIRFSDCQLGYGGAE